MAAYPLDGSIVLRIQKVFWHIFLSMNLVLDSRSLNQECKEDGERESGM